MSPFVCDECGSLENTALGLYWSRDFDHWPDDVRGKALCSACMPSEYSDGTKTGGGRWHGEFRRRLATKEDKVNNPQALRRTEVS